MPAEQVKSRILVSQGQESVLIMDDYGTPFNLQISFTDPANRASLIAAAIAQQQANQDALEAYAAAHGIDLTAAKAAGAAAKAAAESSA